MPLRASLAELWQRLRDPSGSAERPPTLRLFIAPLAPWPSWHPAKGPGGEPMMQVAIELEASNRTDEDIRIVGARLRDHPAVQTGFTVGPRGGPFAKDTPVLPHSRAHLVLMFFVMGRYYAPGQVFTDIVVLRDQAGRDHRLKVGVRGR
jgi:hypothetical protein